MKSAIIVEDLTNTEIVNNEEPSLLDDIVIKSNFKEMNIEVDNYYKRLTKKKSE